VCIRQERKRELYSNQYLEEVVSIHMPQENLITEILNTYEKYGWQLRQALLRPETRAGITDDLLGQEKVIDAEIDALWFSRPSHDKREAWELRLLSTTQYALFETFEADESEEAREEVRREMEARMRDKVTSDEWQVIRDDC